MSRRTDRSLFVILLVVARDAVTVCKVSKVEEVVNKGRKRQVFFFWFEMANPIEVVEHAME